MTSLANSDLFSYWRTSYWQLGLRLYIEFPTTSTTLVFSCLNHEFKIIATALWSELSLWAPCSHWSCFSLSKPSLNLHRNHWWCPNLINDRVWANRKFVLGTRQYRWPYHWAAWFSSSRYSGARVCLRMIRACACHCAVECVWPCARVCACHVIWFPYMRRIPYMQCAFFAASGILTCSVFRLCFCVRSWSVYLRATLCFHACMWTCDCESSVRGMYCVLNECMDTMKLSVIFC